MPFVDICTHNTLIPSLMFVPAQEEIVQLRILLFIKKSLSLLTVSGFYSVTVFKAFSPSLLVILLPVCYKLDITSKMTNASTPFKIKPLCKTFTNWHEEPEKIKLITESLSIRDGILIVVWIPGKFLTASCTE